MLTVRKLLLPYISFLQYLLRQWKLHLKSIVHDATSNSPPVCVVTSMTMSFSVRVTNTPNLPFLWFPIREVPLLVRSQHVPAAPIASRCSSWSTEDCPQLYGLDSDIRIPAVSTMWLRYTVTEVMTRWKSSTSDSKYRCSNSCPKLAVALAFKEVDTSLTNSWQSFTHEVHQSCFVYW